MVIKELENQLQTRLQQQREAILSIVLSSNQLIACPSERVYSKDDIFLLKRVRRLMLIAVCAGVSDVSPVFLDRLIYDIASFDSDECLINARKWLNTFYAKLKECSTLQLQKIFNYYTTLDRLEQELKAAFDDKQENL